MLNLAIVACTLLIFAFGAIIIYRLVLKKNECSHKWRTQDLGTITTTTTYSRSMWSDRPYSIVRIKNKLFSVCDKCGHHKITYH